MIWSSLVALDPALAGLLGTLLGVLGTVVVAVVRNDGRDAQATADAKMAIDGMRGLVASLQAQVDLLQHENERLTAQVGKLEAQVHVLEQVSPQGV